MKTTRLSPSFFHFMFRLCLTGIIIILTSACGGGGSTGDTPQAASVSISLLNMKQPAGSSVNMPVTLSTKSPVTAMQFDIDYDSAGITLDPAGVAATLSKGHRVFFLQIVFVLLLRQQLILPPFQTAILCRYHSYYLTRLLVNIL